jgi:hypothetical protein
MKNYIISLLILACVSCTKEDNESLPGATISKSDLKFAVSQEPGHDNVVMLSSLTKGSYLPFWEIATNSSNKLTDTLNLPFAGVYTIHYSIYTSGGPLGDSTQITVSENDPAYFSSAMWNQLANGIEGKTWVWAVDRPTGICYGNGSGAAVVPEWWQNGIDYLSGEGVADDEMTFNLDGAKNYSFTHAGVSKTATFDLDTLKKTLKFTGSDISLGGGKITYVVVKLTDDELTLAQQGDGWRNLWLFKRKGYTY